jgi:RNA polymerase sigma factor (sigma-70 family)
MAHQVAPAYANDLELARACADGETEAWDRFVAEYRPVLYRAADALDSSGGAREIADAIYGELFSKQLFKYFHGRSSLATWLRALLAQRYVDRYRAARRLEPLPDEDTPAAIAAAPVDDSSARPRFVAAMQAALAAAIVALAPRDRLRLRCYYAQEMTLAQIARITREHEATVSRQLARTRKQLRHELERRLRDDHHFSPDDVRDCISSVIDDAGTLDLGALLGDRKKIDVDRSSVEGVS